MKFSNGVVPICTLTSRAWKFYLFYPLHNPWIAESTFFICEYYRMSLKVCFLFSWQLLKPRTFSYVKGHLDIIFCGVSFVNFHSKFLTFSLLEDCFSYQSVVCMCVSVCVHAHLYVMDMNSLLNILFRSLLPLCGFCLVAILTVSSDEQF